MEIPKVNQNAETTTTTFINIDDKPFDIYINAKLARHFEAGEEDKIVFYVAQVGAKHLVDRILQEQGVPDSNRETQARQDLFAKILPDIAKEVEVKPLTEEEARAQVQKEIQDTTARLEAEFGKAQEQNKNEIELLKEEIKKLKEKKVGRPPKNTTE